MATRTFRFCRVCGAPHGRSKCPVGDLNAVQEIQSGIGGDKEFQVRALRRLWMMPAHKDDPAPVVIAVNRVIDVSTAAERLRQAWGVRA